MKLSVLVDNNTFIDRYFYGEPGLSFYIEDGNSKILFDAGYSSIFIENARKMEIDLLDIDYLVLSHGHLDHTWGIVPLIQLYTEARLEKQPHKNPQIALHPAALNSRVMDDTEIGCLLNPDKLIKHFDIKYTKAPYWLTENLVFLGEIPRKFDFENTEPVGKIETSGIYENDYLIDDSALAYKTSRGIVIITGCSHSGICNIAEYAKEVCNDSRIIDIIGGFHLQNPSKKQLKGTVEYMMKLNPKEVHACHCTDLYSKIELSKVLRLKEVGAGLQLKYE